MSQNNQQNDPTAGLASLVGQIGCVTGFASILIIAAAFGIGTLIDNWLGTNGIFVILFLVGSFPITLYVIVRISMAALRRAQAPASGSQDGEHERPTTTEEAESQ
ncbi:MAG TPA: AtpZ/AtpI family protein [Anaerolineae bacterium]|nr:AtpZ/AtpI family protein [Anaerolineae bacterium]